MIYDNLSERELISLSRSEDARAFEELEKRNKSYIYSWILSRTKDIENAGEVYQTTLIKCWKGLKNFKNDSSFRTWANRIALNAYRDRYRKFKRESDRASSLDEMMDNGSLSRQLSPELPTPTIGNDGFENLRRKELRGDIIKLLDRIPKKSSNILVMHLIKGMPYKEIAKKLKCPIGTVMSRMFYARKDAKEAYNYI